MYCGINRRDARLKSVREHLINCFLGLKVRHLQEDNSSGFRNIAPIVGGK